jgi:hypothetical protein
VRYIDFEGKTPVNTPINSEFPDWKPWTQEEWSSWLSKSKEYLCELERLNGRGSEKEIKARNSYIDSKSAHWGKLKIWLQVLSFGKCWFSEVREKYSHYEVEHFRPKKVAKGLNKNEERDGYWWLAFEYTNYRLCGNVGNRKKGGWFPLKENSLISAADCRCEESETYFLLDPTDPYDPGLLAFNEEGNAIPSPECSTEWEKQRAVETIKRLKLSEHERLTEARKSLWQEITIEIEQFLEAKSKLSTGCNPGIKEKVKAHAKNIRNYTLPTSELSSVARCCILFRNDPNLIRLIA